MRYLLIPAAALLVWPVYFWTTRRSAARRWLRIALGAVFALTALVEGCVGVGAWRAFPGDRQRYDDGLYAMVIYGGAFLAVSLAVLLVGELVVWVRRGIGSRP